MSDGAGDAREGEPPAARAELAGRPVGPTAAPQAAVAPGLWRPSGAAAAAVLAAGVGLLALGGAHAISLAYQPFEEALAIAAPLLIPGGAQVVAYGGKELLALIAWLGGWGLMHWRLRRRDVNLTAAAGLFLLCTVVGTLLLWPPIAGSLSRLLR